MRGTPTLLCGTGAARGLPALLARVAPAAGLLARGSGRMYTRCRRHLPCSYETVDTTWPPCPAGGVIRPWMRHAVSAPRRSLPFWNGRRRAGRMRQPLPPPDCDRLDGHCMPPTKISFSPISFLPCISLGCTANTAVLSHKTANLNCASLHLLRGAVLRLCVGMPTSVWVAPAQSSRRGTPLAAAYNSSTLSRSIREKRCQGHCNLTLIAGWRLKCSFHAAKWQGKGHAGEMRAGSPTGTIKQNKDQINNAGCRCRRSLSGGCPA